MMRAFTTPVKATLPRQNKRSITVKAAQESNNSNTKKERQPWDFRRFVKTVLYFNPPPTPGQVIRSAIELPFKVLSLGGGNTAQQQQQVSNNSNLITPVALRESSSTSMSTAPSTSTTGTVLVSDATTGIGKRVVARLLQQGRHVRALVPSAVSGQEALSSLPAAPGARLEVVPQQQILTMTPSTTSNNNVNAVLSGAKQLVWPITATTSTKTSSLQSLITTLISAGILPKSPGQAIYTPDGLSPAKEWGPVDDVVMGGVSASGFSVVPGAAEDGISLAGVFAGNVTTANNGGFASTRTRNLTPPLNLAAYDGIELKVRGDGQRYKCVIKIDSSWDGVGYTASFDTTTGWQTIKIPFSSLVPVFRAKTQYDAAPFDPSRVTSIQLMLSKFEYDGRLNPTFREGQFELPVERIQAYVEEESADKKGGKAGPRVILVKDSESGSGNQDEEEVVKKSGVPYAVVNVSDF